MEWQVVFSGGNGEEPVAEEKSGDVGGKGGREADGVTYGRLAGRQALSVAMLVCRYLRDEKRAASERSQRSQRIEVGD